MALQAKVGTALCGGFPGDLVISGPQRAEPVVLKTADAKNNVIGRVVTAVADKDGQGVVGGTGSVLGVLTQKNSYAGMGDMAPTITLSNNIPVQVHSMASGIIVEVKKTNGSEAVAKIGAPVAYLTATGEIVTAKENGEADADAGSALIPGARFVRNNVTGVSTAAAVLAIVELN